MEDLKRKLVDLFGLRSRISVEADTLSVDWSGIRDDRDYYNTPSFVQVVCDHLTRQITEPPEAYVKGKDQMYVLRLTQPARLTFITRYNNKLVKFKEPSMLPLLVPDEALLEGVALQGVSVYEVKPLAKRLASDFLSRK